ncbi:MAG: hypothetical protein J5905_00985 [Prevotella sp.]|nr:hypothetical protein [Prevotella sp.]
MKYIKIEQSRSERLDIRVSKDEKFTIAENADKAGLPVTTFCRQVCMGHKPHAALSEEEVQVLRDMKTLLHTVKGFNNALTEYAKGMTKEQRASFILDTRTINEWAKVVGEIYDFYDELKKKIKIR